MFTSLAGLAKSAALCLRLQYHLRDCAWMATLIDRDESEKSRGRMFPFSLGVIFRKHFDAHFDGSMKRAIHLRFEHDKFTQADGVEKIQVIYRRRNHLAVAMPPRGDRAGNIDQVHHASAQNVPKKIGVLRKHKFNHFGARCADGPARQCVPRASLLFFCGSSHSSAPGSRSDLAFGPRATIIRASNP